MSTERETSNIQVKTNFCSLIIGYSVLSVGYSKTVNFFQDDTSFILFPSFTVHRSPFTFFSHSEFFILLLVSCIFFRSPFTVHLFSAFRLFFLTSDLCPLTSFF